MNPPSASSGNQSVQQQAETREAKRRAENAQKAKAAAEGEYPNANFNKVEDGIYQTSQRSAEELRDARILRDLGSTIYFIPETSRTGKKFDAIVNGLHYEFKNVGGNANTLQKQFLKSRSQAPNVFLNLENSNLTRQEVMGALYTARNSVTRKDPRGNTIKGYADSNSFDGGRIILKIKGRENLIYLNVEDLMAR